MAGYDIYERAEKPKGAADVIKTEHWRYRRRRDLIGDVEDWFLVCVWCEVLLALRLPLGVLFEVD
jgi:hypothetical protein